MNKGFSLVELMIVVAILGILYAVALPAYNDFIQDGRRADVQQTLLQTVAELEREYTRQGGYPSSKSVTNTDFYTFAYSSSVSTQFELTATPVSGSAQDGDPCGTLTVMYDGTKTPTSSGCWGN